jgi:EAL domain-containing protein (putative c-di-GMP-specific phosphodiesterase class I)/GGDEF domain-containing protein
MIQKLKSSKSATRFLNQKMRPVHHTRFSAPQEEVIDLERCWNVNASPYLLNRQPFLHALSQVCTRQSLVSDTPFALLQLKVDRFKVIRCSLGEHFAKALLMAVAKRLQEILEPPMLAAYLREDEFAILLEQIESTEDALQFAKLIQDNLRSPLVIEELEIFLSIHIGITTSQISKPEPVKLLNDVGLAAFMAQMDDTHCAVFNPDVREQVTTRLHLENDIRLGLLRHEFFLHYQPLFDLEHHQLIGLEALVRWQHPQQGVVSPGIFIPIAEETGSIIDLGWWILREACQQLKQWQQQFPQYQNLTVNVNLSSQQFSQPHFIEQLDRILQETRLEGQHLKLEITETVLMKNADFAASRLEKLRARGIQLCIDDFGTGYSSLSYLQRFPVSTLKIDRSFIAQMDSESSKSAGIVQAIILLANSLGMTVVAEGIETTEQFWQLKALQCEYGQGYFFSKPLALDGVEKLLQGLHRQIPR